MKEAFRLLCIILLSSLTASFPPKEEPNLQPTPAAAARSLLRRPRPPHPHEPCPRDALGLSSSPGPLRPSSIVVSPPLRPLSLHLRVPLPLGRILSTRRFVHPVTLAAMAAFVSCVGAALTPRRPAVAACAARSSAFTGAAVAALPARAVVAAPVAAPVLPVMPEIEAMVRVCWCSCLCLLRWWLFFYMKMQGPIVV